MLSPFTQGGTWSTTPYNHCSLLASMEDLFGLPYLGYAASPGLNRFGLDVYNASVAGSRPGLRPSNENGSRDRSTRAGNGTS